MPRPREKKAFVALFITEELERIYHEKTSRKMLRKKVPRFETMESLVDHVFSSRFFVDSAKYRDEMSDLERAALPPNTVIVSRNTVRNAVKELLDEAVIRFIDEEIVWRPRPSLNEKHFPILSLAPQTEITINVPGHIFFLTVPEGFCTAIADYLSSQFYKDDILFIPMGRFIMCVGVLPKSVLDGKREKKRDDEPPYEEGVRARVENVLSQFKRRYPSFRYNFPYEMAATSYQETPMRDWFYTLAKESAEKKSMENLLNPRSVGDRFSKTQDGLAFVIDKMDQLEEAGRYDLLPTDDDDSAEGIDPETGLPYIDPETGLPYLEETEELSEEDMEIAAYVWSHPDEIDEAIEQARKAEASKKKKSAATQEDEAD